MDGITEIGVPEIEGLEEVFAENTTTCPDAGSGH
jgi:hypothetical protein